jgi:hypothetical protein
MDASLYTLAENISTHGWVVTVFLVGFIATLVCSIFCTLLDRNVKEIVKLCGAFGIWLIALSINTWEFYLLLVPIGGLVVDEKSLVRETSHSIGPSDAKVTIVEFGDYQCPACAQADPTMERIIDEYAKTGKIRFVFRHFPLSIHANAMPAAEAAEAAGSQGKYFEMHAKIYAGQPEWEEEEKALSGSLALPWDLTIDLRLLKCHSCLYGTETSNPIDHGRSRW